MILQILTSQAAKLNKNSPLPLYYQIKQQIQLAIVSGKFGPGASLPSERQLTKLYGVSRPTVRQATDELMKEGYIYRRRGAGTFVAPNQGDAETPVPSNCLAD